VPGRVAMRGRHAAELTHALTGLLRGAVAAHGRRLQQTDRRLAAVDAGRQLARIRVRLTAADGRLRSAGNPRRHRAEARLQNVAARLEALSPLAVLSRGYAVAWNADRTRALRDASAVAAGETVHVTLAHGELECEVRRTGDAAPSTPDAGASSG